MITTIPIEITRARTALILDHPWFGMLVMRMRVQERSDIPTMATDGTNLYYNRAFMLSLSDAELRGVMAHEVMHCALLHVFRRDSRDSVQWNIACDHAINPILCKSGFQLPKGALNDARYHGLSAEKIYSMLQVQSQGQPQQQPQQPQQQPQGSKGQGQPQSGQGQPQGQSKTKGQGKGQGQGQGTQSGQPQGQGQGTGTGQGQPAPWDIGGMLDPVPVPQPGQGQGTEQPAPMTESDWQIAASQAERIASVGGRLPGGMADELRESRRTRTDYRSVLQRFIEHSIAQDYSWAKPNRRMLSHGHVLPGVYRENTGELVIAVDTSGSVGRRMLDQFAADITHVIGTFRPSKVHVLYCDTSVFHAAEFEPDSEFEFAPKISSGGTQFQPVFDWVAEQEIEPRALIYCTDLECSDSPNEPDYPVLWAVPDSCRVQEFAWGEVMEVELDRG